MSDKYDSRKTNFHLYLLIGQSNMAGRGEVRRIDRIGDPRVFSLGPDDTWSMAVEPVHFDRENTGTGPGLAFGKRMALRYSEASIGLIPCAVGGTSISQWAKGEELYENAVRRARLACCDGVLKGILWYQGETDARRDVDMARKYQFRLDKLFADIRSDLEAPQVPIIVCRIADFVPAEPEHKRLVNEALGSISDRVENAVCITPDGLDHRGDSLHFNSSSYCELGVRFAETMISLRDAIEGDFWAYTNSTK